MFKNKISVKLSLYFGVALLIFALIIGSVFTLLFRNQILNSHKTELEKQAINIAETISLHLDKSNSGMGGFRMYLNVIGDLASSDVWIVDRNLNLIRGAKARQHIAKDYGYTDLPANAEKLVEEGFTGKTAFSEDFSSLLSELTLTVARPIFNGSDQIIGVVLLHSPVEGVNKGISQGITILVISMVLALLVSFLLSIIFSLSFTRPLAIMKRTALRLANGEYTVKTNIEQDDEIGELANTLDILSERLDKASHESERLENMRREFVANISHELKTPVTVIRGSLEALVDKVVTDPLKMEEYHVQMLNESKFLQRLVGDLLELSKLQSMDFMIEKEEISITSIIEDAIRSAGYLAKEKRVEIQFEKIEMDYKIIGDYGRIRQMIMIILDNAIKFSREDERVYINLEKDRLSIRDKGVGIAPEDLPYIFDRFYKSSYEENKIGTGLGLAIAKNIADRHEIRLTAESIEGQGSTFTFIWPNNKI